jgi:hypothetical protein
MDYYSREKYETQIMHKTTDLLEDCGLKQGGERFAGRQDCFDQLIVFVALDEILEEWDELAVFLLG